MNVSMTKQINAPNKSPCDKPDFLESSAEDEPSTEKLKNENNNVATPSSKYIISHHTYCESDSPETDILEYLTDSDQAKNMNRTHFPSDEEEFVDIDDLLDLFTVKGRSKTLKDFIKQVAKKDLGERKEDIVGCLKDVLMSHNGKLDVEKYVGNLFGDGGKSAKSVGCEQSTKGKKKVLKTARQLNQLRKNVACLESSPTSASTSTSQD